MEKTSFILYGEYRAAFQRLSREEQGDLIMAIFAYVQGDAIPPLSPACDMALSFICQQLDRDGQKFRDTCEKRREAGKKGGRPRKESVSEKANGISNKQVEATKAENEYETENDTENENETEYVNENETVNETGDDTSSTYPPKSPQGGRGAGAKKEEPRGFELFWEIYPRKEARGEALKAWQALNPSLELETDILAHVQKRRECWEWTKEGDRYVPHAASFLNQHRWEDEYTLAPPPSTPTYGRQEERCTFADLYREQFGEMAWG